ncbi:MAG: hypothetical protein H5U38_12755, partial [Calditrichaeota bacterium]|nr:hypothetical protein [Calditrichota bacterium]
MMTSKLSDLAHAAAEVASIGATTLKRYFGQATIAQATAKRPFDFVSAADRAS